MVLLPDQYCSVFRKLYSSPPFVIFRAGSGTQSLMHAKHRAYCRFALSAPTTLFRPPVWTLWCVGPLLTICGWKALFYDFRITRKPGAPFAALASKWETKWLLNKPLLLRLTQLAGVPCWVGRDSERDSATAREPVREDP